MAGGACLAVVDPSTLRAWSHEVLLTPLPRRVATTALQRTCTRTPGFVVLAFFCFTNSTPSGAAA